jgi:hypothetical protein
MNEAQLIGQKVKSMDEVMEVFEEIRRTREGNWDRYGRDGGIELWRKTYIYRGVKYEIIRVKYFSFDKPNPLDAKILGSISSYLLLEYTEDERDIAKALEELNLLNNWLWNDTCTSRFENLSLEEHERYLHEVAKRDIDFLLDEALPLLERKVSELKEKIEKIKRCEKKIKMLRKH